jgi:hypothetical protein
LAPPRSSKVNLATPFLQVNGVLHQGQPVQLKALLLERLEVFCDTLCLNLGDVVSASLHKSGEHDGAANWARQWNVVIIRAVDATLAACAVYLD